MKSDLVEETGQLDGFARVKSTRFMSYSAFKTFLSDLGTYHFAKINWIKLPATRMPAQI